MPEFVAKDCNYTTTELITGKAGAEEAEEDHRGDVNVGVRSSPLSLLSSNGGALFTKEW